MVTRTSEVRLPSFNIEDARASTRILVADLDASFGEQLSDFLRNRAFDVTLAFDIEGVRDALVTSPVDVLLADVRLAGGDTRGYFSRLAEEHPRVGCLVTTGYLTLENAVVALDAGAFDIIQKPVIW